MEIFYTLKELEDVKRRGDDAIRNARGDICLWENVLKTLNAQIEELKKDELVNTENLVFKEIEEELKDVKE